MTNIVSIGGQLLSNEGVSSTMSINDLLPKGVRLRKIRTGSELLLAYELNKYAKIMLGHEVKLTDVTIAKELLAGEHFSFVVMNGLDVGFVPERESLVDYSKNARYFFTDTVEGVVFTEVTPEEIHYRYEHDPYANMKLHGDNRSASYVSLIAYLLVKSKLEGVDAPKLIIDHEDYHQSELEYVDLFVLTLYGNKLLADVVEVRYDTGWRFQPEWEAFLLYNRQRGQMNEEYTINDKFKHLKKTFAEGDVVLMYERTKGARGKDINTLKSCYPAVVRYYDATTIRLTYYPIVQTQLTRFMDLISIEEEFEHEGRETIYTPEDYERFTTCTVSFNLTEIGIDDKTWLEETFIIKPIDFDGSLQWLGTGTHKDELYLSTLDTIYAVFEDREVEYNKEKFLYEFFESKNRTPVYDEFMKSLPEEAFQDS